MSHPHPGERVTVRGVDAQVDGDGGDALVGAGDPVGLGFDLQPDLLKVHKLASLAVKELCIFCERTIKKYSSQKGRAAVHV